MTPAIAVIFLMLPLNILTFNIDTSHSIVYMDPQKVENSSYFGYTVVLYPGGKGIGKWIKIGAPKGQDPKITSAKKSGVVYNCPLMQKCEPVDIKRGYFQQNELLEGAWIGGAMDINVEIGRLAICGFRTIYIQGNDYNMVGSCYLNYLNTTTYDEIVPLKGTALKIYKKSVYYYGQGQAGFSVHFPEKENAVLLGAPGVYNWAGTLLKAVDITSEDPVPSRLQQWRGKRSLDREIFIANPVNSVVNAAFDLFGYSITSGYFYASKKLYYAASTPRYYNYKGKVAVVEFDENNPLKEKTSVVGTQFGEYFGASVASGDLNHDGFDDLIVGAPYYQDKTYNEGAVYIFLGRSQGQLRKSHTLYGQQTNGQFGSAIMFLGDINKDDFGDLAIGAPYEEEFSGVLYIYKGNKEGLDLQPCQRIVGKHISPNIRGFGISISRPADVDENGYKDLAVGAHLSGNAVLLRTSPIVVVQYNMQTIPKELKQDTTTFALKICYWYTHFHEMDKIELNRTVVIDKLLNRAILKYPRDGTKIMIINKAKVVTCESIPVNVKNTKNYVAPITVSLTYKLARQQKKKEIVYISDKFQNGTDTFCVRCPVLDEYRSSRSNFIEVPFSLGCGLDNICLSDLAIEAKFPDLKYKNTFVLGSLDYLTLTTRVKNSGEHAYSAQLEVVLPDLIYFRQIPVSCHEQNISAIICNIDNPLRSNSEKTLVLNLDMKKINKNNYKTQVGIELRTITTSNRRSPDRKLVTLTLKREADIMISGKSGQQSVPFGNKTYGMPNFTQIYQVAKIGASPLEKVQINITIPHSIRSSSGTARFIKLYPPEGTFAGQPVICRSNLEYIMESRATEISKELEANTLLLRRKRQVEVFKNVGGKKKDDIIIEGKEYDLVPNRTYFLNCSMENIVCSSILCSVGPFEKRQTPAVIHIRMMFDPSAITGLTGEKDMVLYTTQGIATIQIPSQFIQNGNRSDFVEVPSLFINEATEKKVALWIVILAAIAGFLLLILIIYGLTKVGFFKREKKEELKNLKAATQEMIAKESTPEPLEQGELNASTEGLVDEDENDKKT